MKRMRWLALSLTVAVAGGGCGTQTASLHADSLNGGTRSATDTLLAEWTLPSPAYNGVINYAGTTSSPAPIDSDPKFTANDLRDYLKRQPNPSPVQTDPDIALRLVGAASQLTWTVTYHHTPATVFGPRSLSADERSYLESGDCDSVLLVDATTGAPGDTIQICTVPQQTRDLIAAGKYSGEPAWTLSPA